MDNHPDQNVPLAAAQPPQNANAAPDTAPPLFCGSVSLWLGLKTYVAAAFFIIGSGAAAIWGALNYGSALGMPVMVIGVALFLATDVMLAYTIFRIRSLRYKITRRLIEREQGLFVKRVDSLDLGRVKDVQLKQSIVERMLNIGTIEVFSNDKTDPDMLIEAIPTARPVYEKLRDAVIELNQRRGMISMP
jgi:uncharacterized membrane protein YdbT with pleckstrin-like domain